MSPADPAPTVPEPLAETTRRWLLASARDALARAMGLPSRPPGEPPDDPRLDRPARLFVSWHDGPDLVGCIGTLAGERPLRDAVRHFAVQAGLHDHRTPTPRPEQLPRLHCEISVLTEPQPMAERGLPAITDALVPGRDGLVLHDGSRHAVFLPVVWKSLPDPASFVEALCRKAGIDARTRGPRVTGERFFAEEFAEDHRAER